MEKGCFYLQKYCTFCHNKSAWSKMEMEMEWEMERVRERERKREGEREKGRGYFLPRENSLFLWENR
jgi:hypothetical protein